jgi:hypothetical protein
MKPQLFVRVSFLLLICLSAPSLSRAEEMAQQTDSSTYPAVETRSPGFPHILGSIIFTTLYFPVKLATCVGGQALSAVTYTATFGVKGNYEGGTSGREIGEVGRRSCTGSWIVRPSQVVRDYGE